MFPFLSHHPDRVHHVAISRRKRGRCNSRSRNAFRPEHLCAASVREFEPGEHRRRERLLWPNPSKPDMTETEQLMKLTSAQVKQTIHQLGAQVLPDEHPAMPQLSSMFGEHTF